MPVSVSPLSGEEVKSVPLHDMKLHLLFLALTHQLSPKAPRKDQLIPILHASALMLHVTAVLLPQTLHVHPFPKARKDSLQLSFPGKPAGSTFGHPQCSFLNFLQHNYGLLEVLGTRSAQI